MKKENELKVFLVSPRNLSSEWTSIVSDKYINSLPFNWTFTEDCQNADVIAWDGIYNYKSAYYLKEIIEQLETGRSVLILQNEASTMFDNRPLLFKVDLQKIKYVELMGGNVLPEDLLAALEKCHKKLGHV
jgi:hypothetical protein